MTTTAKITGSPDAMQEDAIQAPRPDRRRGTAILRVLADAHRPFAIAARAADHRQFQRLRSWRRGGQKILNRNKPFAGHRADQRDRSAQLPRQRQARPRGRPACAARRPCSAAPASAGRARSRAPPAPGGCCRLVEFSTRMTASGRPLPGIWPSQHIHRNLLVFRLRSEAVNAGQIDERNLLACGSRACTRCDARP